MSLRPRERSVLAMFNEENASTSKAIGIFPSLLTSSIVEIISPFSATLSSASANGPNGVPSSKVISVWKSSFASTLTLTESYVTKDGSSLIVLHM